MTPTLFTFKTHQIRVVDLDGKPWFVAADVCLAVGLERHPAGGYYHHMLRFSEDEKQRVHRSTHRLDLWFDVDRRIHNLMLVSESGLYKLIMRSDKPEARAFQDWVTRDVLPAIRKDGGYVMGEEKVATGELSEDGGVP